MGNTRPDFQFGSTFREGGSMSFPFTPWLDMPMAISSETIIRRGVAPPIGMASFPAMKAIQPEGVGHQPHIPGSQIIILSSHVTDIFVTIPNILFRNHYRLRNWFIYHWWWNLYN
jgi:hypothetical protein